MMAIDVNVLVYAHREDVKDHRAYRDWLESVINSNTAYGLSELVLGGFIRVVTHPKVFEAPSSLEVAIAFAEQVRTAEHAVCLAPGRNLWPLFLLPDDRQSVYRGLFDVDSDSEELALFRCALQTGTPLGNEKFKGEIQAALQLKLGFARRGRPSKP